MSRLSFAFQPNLTDEKSMNHSHSIGPELTFKFEENADHQSISELVYESGAYRLHFLVLLITD